MDKLNLSVPPDLKALPALAKKVSGFYHAHGLEDPHKLNLALEELIANTIIHGGPSSGKPLEIHLELKLSGSILCVHLNDNGIPFNPLEDAPLPDTGSPLFKRAIGGLGIHLAKESVDRLSYTRKINLNHLEIKLTFSRDQLKKVM